MLGVADIFSKETRHRNLVFNFWSGEELGMLGSAAFASRPPIPIADIAAYLNFDMVGRMQDNKLNVQASGSSPVWDKLVERANVKAGFDLRVQADPYQPTDVQTFNLASVPSLNFFTGSHVDYHKPSDTADKIDYEDLDRIVDFAAAIIRRLDAMPDAPAFTKVEPQNQGGASRTGVRIFTGTIPDYASDAKGLLLGGVVGGGPAEQAGLQKGDVDRRNRRPDDHQHLRLHVRARRAEDRSAGEGRLHAERRAQRDHADPVRAEVGRRAGRAWPGQSSGSQPIERDHVGALRRRGPQLPQQRRHLPAVVAPVVHDVREHLRERGRAGRAAEQLVFEHA